MLSVGGETKYSFINNKGIHCDGCGDLLQVVIRHQMISGIFMVISLPEISDAHYVFLTRQCKRPLIFRARVH